jgi:hypothetical protein
MTKVFDHTNHRKLWLWLADNPKMEKWDWPEWEKNGGNILFQLFYCFACEFDDSRLTCNCPLIWPDNCDEYELMDCLGYGGLYEKWDASEDNQERSQLALQIANLPVKPGVITK